MWIEKSKIDQTYEVFVQMEHAGFYVKCSHCPRQRRIFLGLRLWFLCEYVQGFGQAYLTRHPLTKLRGPA